jgi:hypothetical protein
METKQQIVETLSSFYQDRVEFALLFGSFAAGRQTDSSDVDFAIYLKEPPKSRDQRIDILTEASNLFHRNADCIILNTADIIITMQVLFNGELILNNNPGLYLDFKARKMSEYIDFKYDRKIIEDSMMRGRLYA